MTGMATGGKDKGGFYIKAGELESAVQRFKHVIPKDDADEILKRLLIHQMENRLELHGSDGEVYTTFALSVEPIEGSAMDLSMAVPYALLTGFLQRVPKETILKCVFAEDEKKALYMLTESEYGQEVFHGVCFCKYPKAAKFYSSNIAIMKVDDFRDMVTRTIFAADDMPYSILGGVYFHCLPDRTRFVATNRYMLSMYERADLTFSEPKSVVVPTKALEAFMAGIEDLSGGENVLIYVSEDGVLLSYKGFELLSTFLSEDFPDYERVIPKDTPHVVIFDCDKLRKAVKRLSANTNEEVSRIEFTFSGDSTELYAPNAQRGRGDMEKVECKYSGDTLKVSFCADFLLPILQAIKSKRVIMRIASSNRPVIIEPDAPSLLFNMLCLIMPMAERV